MHSGTLKTNFAINVIGAMVPLAISLVTVPLYVRHIGDARYGVLSIVWVLLGYFGFLDLGLSRAAANALARLRDAPHHERSRVLVTTLVLNLALGAFGSLCLAVFGGYLLQHVLAVPEELKPEIAQAFPWIVALFPLALVSGVGIGTLESRERFLLANLLQVSGGSLGQVVPVMVAIFVGPSLQVVIPTAVAVRALTVFVIIIAVYREEGPLSLRSFDKQRARELLNYGGWISVSGLVAPILTSADQFLIGSILGVASVTHYSVPMNLILRSQVFAGALSRTLFPRLSSVSSDEAVRLASRSLLSLAHGYAAICAPAIILTPVFLRFWIGPDFASVATPVAQILFFGAWINGLAFVPFGLLQSQGRPDVTGKFHVLELAPFILVLWALTSLFGIKGAAVAWSMRCAADAACLLWIARIPKSILLRMALPFPLLVGAAIVSTITESNVLAAFVCATIVGGIATTVALLMADDLRSLFQLTIGRAIRPFKRISNPL